MCKKTIVLLLLISISICLKVSKSNLQAFFNLAVDGSQDGYATVDEYLQFFRLMEPEHQITQSDLSMVFRAFDADADNRVSLQQLADYGGLTIDEEPGPKQIHLGLTGQDREMQVMWVSDPETYLYPIVLWGISPTGLSKMANASITTYNVGHLGFHGKIYRSVITGLFPSIKYYYKVGDLETGTYSELKYFFGPPLKNTYLSQINMAVCGDVGTFAPFGHQIIKQIAHDNFVKPFDFMWLTGDIAYAGMNSEEKGELEPIWDLFGELSESFAAYIPFMPGLGNHEKYYNYSAYDHRYVLPRSLQAQTNRYFSFDYGQLHITYFSSEHPYAKGSEQYTFLQNDLKKARSNPNTKWIFVGAHRPFYHADQRQQQVHPKLVVALEGLLNEYSVDIVQVGHMHDYQRTWPIFNGKSVREHQQQNHFHSPSAPIYVVQGSGGALIHGEYVDPIPEWSIKRINKYGYGKVTIRGNNLQYSFISAFSGDILDQWQITK